MLDTGLGVGMQEEKETKEQSVLLASVTESSKVTLFI